MTTLPNLAKSQWPEGHNKSLDNVFTWKPAPTPALTAKEKKSLYNAARYAETKKGTYVSA